MRSYNFLNGVPACANKGLLTTVLREQWRFEGFVVSDYDAWALLYQRNYTGSMEAAAYEGLNAGLDQEGGTPALAIAQLAAAIGHGKTTAAAVGTALRRLFRARILLGMLDPPASVPYNALRYNATQLATDAGHRAVARRAAEESLTLLKNNDDGNDGSIGGRKVLPLVPASLGGRAIALIGPHANVSGALMGNYADRASSPGAHWGPSVLEALQARLAPAGCSVTYAPGLAFVGSPASADGFAAAARLAASAETAAVVVVLGLGFNDALCQNATTPDAGNNGSGSTLGAGTDPNRGRLYCEAEASDRPSIELPGGQAKMVAALRAALRPGVPLIGLLVHGGAIALGASLGQLDALLDAWYPGIEGGGAIAEALVGDFSPAGRSAVTWYSSTAELPPSIGHMGWYANATAVPPTRGVTYRYFEGTPLFPFGFGLSYTTFRYSDLALNASSSSADPCDAIGVAVTVSNTGEMDSDEVVQVYTRQPDASVPAPTVRLAAFARVHVQAGCSSTVSLTLAPEARAVVRDNSGSGGDVYGASASQWVEKGRLQIFVGGGQPDFYPGHVHATVKIAADAALATC